MLKHATPDLLSSCYHPLEEETILENAGMMRESQISATVWPSAGILERILYS